MTSKLFATETEMVAAFCASVGRDSKNPRSPKWTIYPETAGWDVLLVGPGGIQVGVEAKLLLNAKVLEQALPKYRGFDGPDYRAVLVPRDGLQNHLKVIAAHLGLTVLTIKPEDGWRCFQPDLPDESLTYQFGDWHSWHPAERCKLPDYVPDVAAGRPSPLILSQWKIKAIKLVILLDRRGAVSRADMKRLDISPSRWTDPTHGLLERTPRGYVRCGRTPDFRAQHPTNYAEIEADFEKWAPADTLPPSQPDLIGSAA